MDKCDICGFTTNSHLVHIHNGKCYCVRHYLMHILHGEIENYRYEYLSDCKTHDHYHFKEQEV